MRSFKNFLLENNPTGGGKLRRSIPHLGDLTPKSLSHFLENNKFVGTVTEKTDGSAFQFGVKIDSEGNVIFRSRTSSGDWVDNIGGHSEAARKKFGDNFDPKISGNFDNIHKRLSENKELVKYLTEQAKKSKTKESYLQGEIFSRAAAIPSPIKGAIRFVKTDYDSKKIGAEGTFVIHTGVEGNQEHIPYLQHIKNSGKNQPFTIDDDIIEQPDYGKLTGSFKKISELIQKYHFGKNAPPSKWGLPGVETSRPEGFILHFGKGMKAKVNDPGYSKRDRLPYEKISADAPRIAIAGGRFSLGVPTIEHHKLVGTLLKQNANIHMLIVSGPTALEGNGKKGRDRIVGVSPTDPLTTQEKVEHLRKLYPEHLYPTLKIVGSHEPFHETISQATHSAWFKFSGQKPAYLTVVGGEGTAGLTIDGKKKDEGSSIGFWKNLIDKFNYMPWPFGGHPRMMWNNPDTGEPGAKLVANPRGETSGSVVRKFLEKADPNNPEHIEMFKKMMHPGMKDHAGYIEKYQERLNLIKTLGKK